MIRRAVFFVSALLAGLFAAQVSAPPVVVEKLRATSSPKAEPTPTALQWRAAFPNLRKPGATWSPWWSLPDLPPRAGK